MLINIKILFIINKLFYKYNKNKKEKNKRGLN